MTLNQTALKQTLVFVIGTVTVGILAGYAYTLWPSATKLTLIAALFAWITWIYYQISKSRLEYEAQKIQRALRG